MTLRISVFRFSLFGLISIIVAFYFSTYSTDIFSEASFRKTQTFAGYSCFRDSSDVITFLRCLIVQPVGVNDNAYGGLEFPLFSLLDYMLNRTRIASNVDTVLPALAFSLFCFVSMVIISNNCRIYYSYGFYSQCLSFSISAVAIMLIVLNSPVTIFFASAYQPDLLAAAFIVTGLAIADTRFRLFGLLIAGLGMAAKPQYTIIACAFLAGAHMSHASTLLHAFRGTSRLVKELLIVLLPMTVYFLLQAWLVRLGFAVYYPTSSLITPIWIFGAEEIVRVSNEEFFRAGPATIILLLFVTAIAATVALIHGKITGVLGSLAVPLAVLLTYSIIFQAFRINLYYGIIFVLALVLSVRNALDVLGWIEKFRHVPFLISLLAVTALSNAFYRPNTEPGALKLIANAPMCAPSSELIEMAPAYLNCVAWEPTCRMAVGGGLNLWHESLVDEQIRRRLIEERAYYYTCGWFTEHMESASHWPEVREEMSLVKRLGDWSVFRFDGGGNDRKDLLEILSTGEVERSLYPAHCRCPDRISPTRRHSPR